MTLFFDVIGHERTNKMDKRYEVGDVVRIVHDNQGREYGYVKEMSALVDVICTVSAVMYGGVCVKEISIRGENNTACSCDTQSSWMSIINKTV